MAGLAGVFRDMGVTQVDKERYEDATDSYENVQTSQHGHKSAHVPYSTMRPPREARDVRDSPEYSSLGAHLTSTFPRSGSRLALKQMAAQKQEEQDEKDREEDAERERERERERGESDSDTYPFSYTTTDNHSCRPEDPKNKGIYRSPPDSPNYRDLEDSLNGSQHGSNTSPPSMKNGRRGYDSSPRGTFSTPILPMGQCLKIEILSTWGDDLYVGLNGLDIFDADGNLLSNISNSSSSSRGVGGAKSCIESVVRENKTCAMDASHEYQNDPREVTNLVNGTNFTRDDLHVWLAPLGCLREKEIRKYQDGNDVDNDNDGNENDLITTISINFTHAVVISLIRVFNYNKSRTHCTRGVKDCIFRLDDVIIYRGYVLVF